LFQEKLRSDQEAMRLRDEVENVSNNLASTYEEISLLYGLTQNLRISSSPEDLGQLALDWLIEVVPCEGLAIEYLDRRRDEITDDGTTEESLFLTCGDCPVDEGEFAHLIEAIDHSAKCGPLVANRNITSAEGWLFPSVRELVVVPLAEGKNVFGYLAAFNHSDESEFGTIEASLLGSVGVILGIHSANIDLYRKQAEMLTGIVRALTSAIDAKDPYTCGHSDRVARIAVRLAEELGVDPETLRMLYMAGLLHDIGKIGIDDNVLRKPGRLTDAEYEHIKLHPELGFKILKDLSHLSEVLPIVLHHHEQWDGRGYPHGLEGENIPMAARITAVADAYDAMTSDRPYRRGMDEEKVEEIFRSGAGKQWDARVVSAFFRAREDVRDISSRERSSSPMEFQVW